ncbi:hypothetical protein WS75_00960 [Burkholderia sp. FL-7-2-10-S1-D7]|nr:hypothetical protein WS75_00960 [Burkholderia sp. FL-7-2-10-S1-D7]
MRVASCGIPMCQRHRAQIGQRIVSFWNLFERGGQPSKPLVGNGTKQFRNTSKVVVNADR